MRLWLWLTTGMKTNEWVAVHRYHHRYTDESEDPHSPTHKGIFGVLFGGAFLYNKAAAKINLKMYGAGTPDDWMERNVYAHSWLGVSLMLLIDLMLFGIAGAVVWGIQMLWIPFWAAGVINGIGHYIGYRNTDTPDKSRNILPVGILIGGEEMHNNHHHNPQSAKFSEKWWEFDIGWMYIQIGKFFGVVK
jgi:stearoyl-CoA desaturase (delta-9 desaturase)